MPDSNSKRRSGEIVVLCVGTVEPRKNHERLLDAFEIACARSEQPLRLILAGSGHSIEPELANRIRDRINGNSTVEWEESPDDRRVAELYSACDFSIYPSTEEGFGLPILESLWYRKPAICADFGAMREVAGEGCGCLLVDVWDVEAMADVILQLAQDAQFRSNLEKQAAERKYRTWEEYCEDVANRLCLWAHPSRAKADALRIAISRTEQPLLSLCISTYNRAEWLDANLRNLTRLYPEPVAGVEIVICDNASTDISADVVTPYLVRPDIVYQRNARNCGMLGNLRQTVSASRGSYVWILGDDDLILPGAIERVLAAIRDNPGVALVYLNYAHTSVSSADGIGVIETFLSTAEPIVPPEPDRVGPVREICARNENFFTAIYTLVFRRDHALRAYTQDTSGPPFSTMLTCIPTTYYALNYLMEETGVWIGVPQIVVNLNVSWADFAPLWILERIPEVYDVAQSRGVSADDVDRWRRHSLSSVAHFFEQIFTEAHSENARYFDPGRLVARFSHLPEFVHYRPRMMEVYAAAHQAGHPAASAPLIQVFGL